MPYKNQDYGIVPDTFESINVKYIAGGNTGVTTTLFYNGLTGAFTLGDSAAGITGELDTTGGLVKSAKLELTNHIKLNNTAGTSGQLLTSGGENAVPTWTTASALSKEYANWYLNSDIDFTQNTETIVGSASNPLLIDVDSGNCTLTDGNKLKVDRNGKYLLSWSVQDYGSHQLTQNVDVYLGTTQIRKQQYYHGGNASTAFYWKPLSGSTIINITDKDNEYILFKVNAVSSDTGPNQMKILGKDGNTLNTFFSIHNVD